MYVHCYTFEYITSIHNFFPIQGSQRRIQDYLLLNYAPIWLHLTLDALISSSSTQSYSSVTSHNVCSTIIPEINDQPYPEDNKNVYTSCLSKKIHSYLFDSFGLNKPLLPIKPAADNKKLKQSSHHTTRNDTNSTKPSKLIYMTLKR